MGRRGLTLTAGTVSRGASDLREKLGLGGTEGRRLSECPEAHVGE